ncbi:TerB family tellurite resistance protein [Leptolyngbya sp. KIOST-1]|uniref:TerB family tellurite resistance protein n=1 Tax=Leptolyngbya sp. KIOST-1 TaxID=1229172 RepID=UPI00068BE029|nr:TerB family tellurite resistance protein [Leptolyngbya sp. KIOST-1]
MPDSETLACLETLAAVAKLKGDPTPQEFEAFLAALNSFAPLPVGVTPEGLLRDPTPVEYWLAQIQTPAMQQQVYRGAAAIARAKGIDPQEAALLAQLREAFQLDPETARTLARQPLRTRSSELAVNSALAGMAALIGRQGEVRRLIFDYALGAAIVGLVPLRGGGTLELKFLIVLGLILKMIWDIRNVWGKPQGQDVLAVVGNLFGFMAAVIAGFLAWATLVGLGVVVPYVGAFARAAGFATATWVAGQSTNQFYTSQKRPDFTALTRAFPNLMSSDR